VLVQKKISNLYVPTIQEGRQKKSQMAILTFKINRLRWAGCVIRRENEGIIKRIMLVKPEVKRKKGRPRMR
jgi:hypothetical protein